MKHELEQFLGLGNEVIFWIFTYKNIGGVILGGMVGSRLGEVLGGGGWTFLMIALVGAAGLILTLNWRGLMLGRRLLIRAQFYLRRSIGPRILDAAALYAVVERREQAIIVRQGDTTIMAPQRAPRTGGTT